MQKQVKIIGLSINEQFGSLRAVSLGFDPENRLTTIKGEVGAGKTTLQKALKLTTQGSQTLQDKTLLGDNVDIVAQLLDGETNVFVGCKSNATGALDYFMYTTDSEGKKLKDPVIDGKKATPANYLKSLQTALTWDLNSLTSENPTVQREISLKIYESELEKKGVYLNKSHAKYVDSILDKIEKAKERRNYLDMKRKEVGGIADDMQKKGIDFSDRRLVKDVKELEKQIAEKTAEITLATTNATQAKNNVLLALRNKGLELNAKLKTENDLIQKHNRAEQQKETTYLQALKIYNDSVEKAKDLLVPLVKDEQQFNFEDKWNDFTAENLIEPKKPELDLKKELEFSEKNTCISLATDFEHNAEIAAIITDYRQVAVDYKAAVAKEDGEVDTKDLEAEKEKLEAKKKRFEEYNSDAIAVNAFIDWKDQNIVVKNMNKDYFMKLTEIETGVEGLYICPEYIEEGGEKIAKDNDIYLMYDGSYDPEYFCNPNKEIRKLASYSDTQKPMICLLIQRYLLSKKEKALPYLWIDQVPIDNKTKKLLDRMSEELGLWLFVNWTGDFNVESLQHGEILIENGQVFVNENYNESN
jgi:hypothetical protein